jgi:hypothetical protein
LKLLSTAGKEARKLAKLQIFIKERNNQPTTAVDKTQLSIVSEFSFHPIQDAQNLCHFLITNPNIP